MLASFSEFKFFQSFRVPVEEADGIRFLAEAENDQGVMEYIEDARLIDVSVCGMGFSTANRLAVGEDLRFSIHFKKINLDLNVRVVRAFTSSLKDNSIIYGVEVEEDDEVKRFIEQYIYSFSPDRLRDCLVQIALTERYSTAFEGFEMFSLLLSLFKDITKFGEKEDFVETMLEEVTRILNASRATIFLINPESNELEAIAALGVDKKMLRLDYRKGIAGSVFTSGISLNIDVVKNPTRFYADMDGVTGFKTRSILCHPVHNREDKIIGVIEVLNKRNDDRFSVEDEKIMKVISLVFSSVFHNYNPISEQSAIRRFSVPSDRKHVLIGRSKQVMAIRNAIIKMKDLDAPLLIYGEGGTGKSLLAYIVHMEGKRGLSDFVHIPCSGIDEADIEKRIFGAEGQPSLLETCKGGTVYLHEIAQLPLKFQTRLVDILLDKRLEGSNTAIDLRIMASTVANLEKLVSDGKFNRELYEYISKSYITVEPLRKRKDDIKDLINFFLKVACKDQGFLLKSFSPAVMKQFHDYDWPGNVQELKLCVERAVIYNPKTHVISNINNMSTPLFDPKKDGLKLFDDIPYASDPSIVLKDRLALVERQMIMAEIKRHNGNKSKAAREMGISREALRKKLMMSQDILAALEGYKKGKKVGGGDDGDSTEAA